MNRKVLEASQLTELPEGKALEGVAESVLLLIARSNDSFVPRDLCRMSGDRLRMPLNGGTVTNDETNKLVVVRDLVEHWTDIETFPLVSSGNILESQVAAVIGKTEIRVLRSRVSSKGPQEPQR